MPRAPMSLGEFSSPPSRARETVSTMIRTTVSPVAASTCLQISAIWSAVAELRKSKTPPAIANGRSGNSYLLRNGVHPKIASERLGHSKVGITLDLYSHVIPGMQEDAAAMVDEALKAAAEWREANGSKPVAKPFGRTEQE